MEHRVAELSSHHRYIAMQEEKGNDNGYTQDGTVDLKGNPILRSRTGGWTACAFVVGTFSFLTSKSSHIPINLVMTFFLRMIVSIVYEVFERMAYYGISSNLFIYLTKKLHQGTVESANLVTCWVGTIWMTPVLGAYVADAVLGRYWTFLVASIIYLSGLSLLTLSVTIHPLKPSSCSDPIGTNCNKATTLQVAVFFLALYTLALGTGGTKPNISTIGADQFDELDPKEKSHKLSFFNWWMFSIFLGTLFSNTLLVYIQDNVGWTLGYGLPTIGLAISILIFLAGTPFYRHKMPTGSPFTKMVRVIISALRKREVDLPVNPDELYELDLVMYGNKGRYRIASTSTLRFLNKASVRTGSTSPWMLCPVTQVEETKQMIRMIPILITTFIPSAMISQVSTLFVKQGTTLKRDIGNYKIPPASLAGFVTISMLISVVLYDRVFVRVLKKWTNNPRGISLLQRMGIGMSIHIVIMVVATFTELYRLGVAKKNGLVENGGQVPLSIFVLLPQFVLMGIADAFLEVAKIEFFYDQAAESMKSLGTSYSMVSLGVGSFISSLLLSVVSRVTKGDGGEGWIQNNLNASSLDYYYALLAALNFFNFIFFLLLVRFYVYKVEVSDSMRIHSKEQQ